MTKDNLLINLNEFNDIINKIEKDKKITDKDNKKNEETNEDIKLKEKIVHEEVESLYNCLKVFQEIFTSVDTPGVGRGGKNENNINLDEYE